MGHQCCNKQKVKRGLWSPEEDEKLIKHITAHGHGSWSSVPKLAGLQRCGKSCRLRWINYLRPDVKRGSFSAEEERIIIEVQRILGNKWAQIAKYLPGRTDNEVKNFWNSSIKKKLIAQAFQSPTQNLLVTSPNQSHNTNICNNNNTHVNPQPRLMSFEYPSNNSPCCFSILNQISTTPPLESHKNIVWSATATTTESRDQLASPSPWEYITTHHDHLQPGIFTSFPLTQSGFETAWISGGGFQPRDLHEEKMIKCQGLDSEKADVCSSSMGAFPDESLEFDIDFVELLNC